MGFRALRSSFLKLLLFYETVLYILHLKWGFRGFSFRKNARGFVRVSKGVLRKGFVRVFTILQVALSFFSRGLRSVSEGFRLALLEQGLRACHIVTAALSRCFPCLFSFRFRSFLGRNRHWVLPPTQKQLNITYSLDI